MRSVMESRWCIERNTSSCTFTVFHTFQWRKMTLMTISSHVTANAFIIMRKSAMVERLIGKTDLVSFKPISYFISPMDYHYARYANRVIDTRWENPIFYGIDEKRYDVMREMRLWLKEFYTFFNCSLILIMDSFGTRFFWIGNKIESWNQILKELRKNVKNETDFWEVGIFSMIYSRNLWNWLKFQWLFCRRINDTNYT